MFTPRPEVENSAIISVRIREERERGLHELLDCLHSWLISVPFPRLNPLSLVFLVGSVLASWDLLVPFVSFCSNLTVVG